MAMNQGKAVSVPFLFSFILALIAGFSDVFGFIELDQLFTAHITGNLVIAIVFLHYHYPGILPKLLAIPLFMVVAALISLLVESHFRSMKKVSFWLFVEMLLFGSLMIFGRNILPADTFHFTVICMLPIVAMAIHNTLWRTHFGRGPAFTVMTGNLTQFCVDLAAFILYHFSRNTDRRSQALKSMRMHVNMLLGFMLGGLLATLCYWFGFYALLAPIVLFGILIIWVYEKGDDFTRKTG